MTAQPTKGTKLAFKLRQACNKVDPTEDFAVNNRLAGARHAADQLDLTAYSLGARGERIKTLGAYFTAKRFYEEITGGPYTD